MRIREGLSFDDVLLVPNHGVLNTRKEADIRGEVTPGHRISVPIIAANMPSVVNFELARAMSRSGGYSILHRFQSIEDQVTQYREVQIDGEFCGAAIGLDDWARYEFLWNAGCRTFCLDVAHGDCQRVVQALKFVTSRYNTVKWIVGNVATYEGAKRLLDAGADCLKVGIGPGAACTTREVTGVGVPQLTAIDEVARAIGVEYKATLIADGGIKNSGDIVKALAAGADTVMVGRLLAGCDEAPEPGVYYGNASHKVNGHNAPEGVHGEVESSGPVSEVMKKLAWGIRSGVSYLGARNLEELRRNACWYKVSHSTHVESGVRI